MKLFFGMMACVALWATAAHATPGDYAKNSRAFYEATHPNGKDCSNIAATPELKDEIAQKLESDKKNDPAKFAKFMRQWASECGATVADQPVEGGESVAETDGSDEPVRATRPQGVQVMAYQGRRLRSFDAVAADSRSYRTSAGRSYALRNLHGGSHCSGGRQLHRTDQCYSIGHGGIRCRMVCR